MLGNSGPIFLAEVAPEGGEPPAFRKFLGRPGPPGRRPGLGHLLRGDTGAAVSLWDGRLPPQRSQRKNPQPCGSGFLPSKMKIGFGNLSEKFGLSARASRPSTQHFSIFLTPKSWVEKPPVCTYNIYGTPGLGRVGWVGHSPTQPNPPLYGGGIFDG